MSTIINFRVDHDYKELLAGLLHDLGITDEDKITAKDYEAVEDYCDEMGVAGYTRSRILDLVPCEESEEEIQAWKDRCATEFAGDDENCDEEES